MVVNKFSISLRNVFVTNSLSSVVAHIVIRQYASTRTHLRFCTALIAILPEDMCCEKLHLQKGEPCGKAHPWPSTKWHVVKGAAFCFGFWTEPTNI